MNQGRTGKKRVPKASAAKPRSRYTKPFLSVLDQVALLQSRGMQIPDSARASVYLERVGYYRLSGYWYPLRTSQPAPPPAKPGSIMVEDNFRPGSSFDHVIDLYVFDKKLRLLMLDGLERLEVGFRSNIVALLGSRSPIAHRDGSNFNQRFVVEIDSQTGLTWHQSWLARLDKAVHKSGEDFAKHFKENYYPPMPLWIAVEVWDYGMLSRLLEGLSHSALQSIATKYGCPRYELLTSWVRTLNFVRNICAHHGRLWNRVLVDQPKPPRSGEIPPLDHLVSDVHAHSRLYAAAAIIKYFLGTANPNTSWGERLKQLVATLPGAPGVSVRHMGFPQNWQTYALWSAPATPP